MTDLEISKALALAIGWTEDRVAMGAMAVWVKVPYEFSAGHYYAAFDYRDWNVISPIAEKYDCFPEKHWQGPPYDGWLAGKLGVPADTPQKAIALAVIQGAKK